MDLASVLQSLLNLFAGIAVAVSIATIIIGIILRTRGDPRANNLMLYGFVGLLIALLGWPQPKLLIVLVVLMPSTTIVKTGISVVK